MNFGYSSIRHVAICCDITDDQHSATIWGAAYKKVNQNFEKSYSSWYWIIGNLLKLVDWLPVSKIIFHSTAEAASKGGVATGAPSPLKIEINRRSLFYLQWSYQNAINIRHRMPRVTALKRNLSRKSHARPWILADKVSLDVNPR